MGHFKSKKQKANEASLALARKAQNSQNLSREGVTSSPLEVAAQSAAQTPTGSSPALLQTRDMNTSVHQQRQHQTNQQFPQCAPAPLGRCLGFKHKASYMVKLERIAGTSSFGATVFWINNEPQTGSWSFIDGHAYSPRVLYSQNCGG